MSRVIDSRTVEMEFDNSKFAKNCENTMKQLDDLDKTLSKTATGADFSSAEKALSNLGKMGSDSAAQIADGLSNMESRFSAWGTFVGRIVENVADKFTDLATSMAKAVISESTIGAMKAGLEEYNLLMTSMQSMKVLTGESTDNINAMFDKLNTYADKTKYTFSDMTRNLSMFAASGATLDEMEISMEGIANWMAAVGAPASDMNRIIYNIGQAFSKGYMALIDWKSIENSKGMNGQQFVKVWVDEAWNLGKLTADQYGEALQAELEGNLSGWFREAISGKDAIKGFDKEVMLAVFKDFAENPEYLKAATQLKTFGEFLDNVKEEMGSGWQVTWRNVIGDLDQATKLFKGLKDSLTEYWDLGGDARNQLIEEFNQLGGSEQTYNILTSLIKMAGELKEAFMSGLIPEIGSTSAFDLYAKVHDIATKLMTTLNQMQTYGTGAQDVMESLGTAAGHAFNGVKDLFNGIKEVFSVNSEGLGQLAVKIADVAEAFSGRLFGSIGKIGDKLAEFSHGPLNNIISDIGAVAYALADLTEWALDSDLIGKAFNGIWKSIQDVLESIGIFTGWFDDLDGAIGRVATSTLQWATELHNKTDEGTFVHAFAEILMNVNEKILEMMPTLLELKEKWNDCWEAVHEGDWTRFSTFIKEDLIPAFEKLFGMTFDDFTSGLQEILWWRPDWSQYLTDLEQIWGSLELGKGLLEDVKSILEALGETIVSFWHRITSGKFTGSAFANIKEALGLDDTEAFKFDALEKFIDKYVKGAEKVDKATETITTCFKTMEERLGGPNTETLTVKTLSLDGDVSEMEQQMSLWERIKDKFSTYWDYVTSIDINEDGIANWIKLFAGVTLIKAFKTVAEALKQFATTGKDTTEKLLKLPASISKALGGIYDSLEAYAKKLGSEAFATKWKAIAVVFATIVGAIAVFSGLEYLGVDVTGNALVIMALFGVLVKVMEAAQSFATGWQALDSVALAAACLGFGSIIKNMTIAISVLTGLSLVWQNLDAEQQIEIFSTFAFIIAAAYASLMSAGKMMMTMNTGLEWAVMYVVLSSIAKLFKTMATTLAELTLIEALGKDNTSNAIMDLLAIWGMVELLVVTVMGFATKIGGEKGILEAAALMYVIKKLFTSMTTCLVELALVNEFTDSAWTALGQLAIIFSMIEALLWSAVGVAAICTNTALMAGLATTTATLDQMGDMIIALGLVVTAFALLGKDKVMVALEELGIVLAELVVTIGIFAGINKLLGGTVLNVTGLVACIVSLGVVVGALAAFQAACSTASISEIEAAVKAFETMLGDLMLVFAALVAGAAIITLAKGVGEGILIALGVLTLVWDGVAAGAILAGVAGLAMAEAIDIVVGAMAKFSTIDMAAFVTNADLLLEYFKERIPTALADAAVAIATAVGAIGPLIGAALVSILADCTAQLAVALPAFIQSFDAMLAAAIVQMTLDISKYGQLLVACITVDLDELATMLEESSGIIHACQRCGDAIMNTLIASILGDDVADKLVPVADSFTGELKSALEETLPRLQESGYFAANNVTQGMSSGLDEGKYTIFTKGQESADQYGQGIMSKEDILKSFGITMGTTTANSLVDQEVQSVYERAGLTSANTYGDAFTDDNIQALMKQFGIDTGSMLGDSDVTSIFSNSGGADLSSFYQEMFDKNPDLKKQLEDAGIDVGNMMSEANVNGAFTKSGESNITEYNKSQKDELKKHEQEMIQYSAKEVETYYKSQATLNAAKTAGKDTSAKVAEGMKDQQSYNNAESAGRYLIQGASNGMNAEANSYGGILDRARSIANSVVNTLRGCWRIYSPSRVAYELGAYFSEGLGNGLEDEGQQVVNDSQYLAEDILESFTSNLDPNGLGNTITITPEVDLSNVEQAAKKTSSMFNATKSMQMSAQYALAGTDANAAFGNTYNINVNEVDANNGYSVGRDLQRYLVRGY